MYNVAINNDGFCSGTRVMAVTDRGICNLARCEASLMWCIPDEWTFEEAATVPVAYTTVYMALVSQN